MRAGALYNPTNSWRVEGRDYGLVEARVDVGSGNVLVLPGFAFSVSHGHEVPNSVVPSGWAVDALRPGSVVEIDGVPTLFATATGADGRPHVVALQPTGDAFDSSTSWAAVEPYDAIDGALAAAGASATDPVVWADDDGFVMFYGLARNGTTRIKRARP